MGFNHRYTPEDLNNALLSQGCVLTDSSTYGNSGQNRCCKDRAGSEASSCPVQRWTGGHIFSMTNSNRLPTEWLQFEIQSNWAPFAYFHLSALPLANFDFLKIHTESPWITSFHYNIDGKRINSGQGHCLCGVCMFSHICAGFSRYTGLCESACLNCPIGASVGAGVMRPEMAGHPVQGGLLPGALSCQDRLGPITLSWKKWVENILLICINVS